MVSGFVREQKRYSQRDLCGIFRCPEEKAVPLIKKLKEFGVLKAVRTSDVQRDMSDLLEEDVEVADVEAGEDEFLYVFTFVGVIVVSGCALKCYPKYLLNADRPTEELRQVLKVLEKYNSNEQIIRMVNDSSESSSFNLLAVLLFLLQDYYENGIYSETKEIIESNGTGEILWDKTINDTFAAFVNGRPYYTNLQTKKSVIDDFDYFRRLHECVLTVASAELREAGLLDLFEITEVNLTDEELDDFGEKDYILYRIEKELSVQFNTRKQMVLKTLYTYIVHSGSLYDTDSLSLFGTNSFNLVWEGICADVMDNQLDVRLGKLHLPISLQPGYDGKQKLIDIIEKPLWTATGQTAAETLIPDIVAIDGTQFIIFDAKYYNARLTSGLAPKGQPGIESVTKQYLYQQAYKEFIADHGFADVKNCFLLPTEKSEIEDGGEVSMKMFKELKLQNIQARFLPAQMVYDLYLSGEKLDISNLFL